MIALGCTGISNRPHSEEKIVVPDLARLQQHLDEAPHDVQSRLVLADLFEEQGQLDLARCQRWLARREKWPDANLKPFEQAGWHWWSCPDEPKRLREHAALPLEVQQQMPRGEWLYPTRAEAESVLAEALAKLPGGG